MGYGQVGNVFCKTGTTAVLKRVVYRPATASDTVRVGDLVCYNSDIAADYDERTTTPISGGTAYAEGSQNYTGRFLIVEKPASTNLHQFAGVVASLGSLAGTDGDWISIYVPDTGALIPVMTDLNCTRGATVLAVKVAQYEATNPVYGGSTTNFRIIGLAEETVDRSSTDGLVWARITSAGIFGVTGGAGGVSADVVTLGPAATTGDMYGHFLSLKTTATGGSLTGIRLRAELDGAGSSVIALRAEAVIGDGSSAQDGDCAAITSHLIFKSGATAGAFSFYGLEAKIENQDGTPADLSSGTIFAALKLVTQISSSTPPPANSHYLMRFRVDGADKPDGLFKCEQATDIGLVANTDTVDYAIPIRVGGTTYYIAVTSALS